MTSTIVNYKANLPEDVLFIILSFLPIKTRIALIKNKYTNSVIKKRLSVITYTEKNMKTLMCCAMVADNIINLVLPVDWKCELFKLVDTLCFQIRILRRNFHNEKKYTHHYFTRMIDLINKTLKYYTRVYKPEITLYTQQTKKQKQKQEKIETLVLKLFTNLRAILNHESL